MIYNCPILLLLLCFWIPLIGQEDSVSVHEEIYNRPFINAGNAPVSVGGYLEGNSNYFSEDGISEGFTMEMRRFNLFLYSQIIPKVSFLAELEFEHGTEEIALETAQVDFEFNPALQLRAGILLAPIGAYNQNHDGPKWEFIERPLVSTEIIPSTLSDIGFGLNGILPFGSQLLTYDAYLVNGLTDGIILNEEGRTFLQSGKSEERLAEDNNGSPTFTGRLAIKHLQFGELGLSYYGGAYNSYRIDGEVVDEKRNLSIVAIDFNTDIHDLDINGELAYNTIDVPSNISEIFGKKQRGGYLELIYPLVERELLGFEKARINAGLRLEHIDYNIGTFSRTGTDIHDEVNALALALNFRPSANTALKANYRHHWIRDLLGNPTVKSAGFQFGVATYF